MRRRFWVCLSVWNGSCDRPLYVCSRPLGYARISMSFVLCPCRAMEWTSGRQGETERENVSIEVADMGRSHDGMCNEFKDIAEGNKLCSRIESELSFAREPSVHTGQDDTSNRNNRRADLQDFRRAASRLGAKSQVERNQVTLTEIEMPLTTAHVRNSAAPPSSSLRHETSAVSCELKFHVLDISPKDLEYGVSFKFETTLPAIPELDEDSSGPESPCRLCVCRRCTRSRARIAAGFSSK
ncbi:hypothetical protein FVE85_8727 [Porphyridium purpureum]|uniref:Uncharacterized protein n=1 Tax=Porphyridium purpureum TaxID=35688 RepID=A0A5J4YR51_PORPP|nr:hypothetical protein FVE85_8727 [Porphyridium purpureum]|eukprot:POR1240..scf296_7